MSISQAMSNIGRYKSLSHEIRHLLLESFVEGDLTPGTRINDLELAGKLGVSRTPVREALRELQEIGIIETLPARITRVLVPSKNEFDHARVVWKSLIELLIADIGNTITDTIKGDLHDLCKRLADASDVTTQATLTFRFFGTIADLTNNAFLRDSIHRLAYRMRLGYHDHTTAEHKYFRITFAQATAFLGKLGDGATHALHVLDAIVEDAQHVDSAREVARAS